jgi:Cys-rich repeat protein
MTGTTGATTGTGSATGAATTTGGTGTMGATTTAGGTTGGTTSPALGGPFVPYDAGPRTEVPIDLDAGCSADEPQLSLIRQRAGWVGGGSQSNTSCGCNSNSDCASGACSGNTGQGNEFQCVQCIKSSQCPGGQVCEINVNSPLAFTCVQCASYLDCDAGEVCDIAETNATLAASNSLWPGGDICRPDCRLDAGTCKPGFCERDSGICYSGWPYYSCSCAGNYGWPNSCPPLSLAWCQTDDDCKVDGGGACYLINGIYPLYYTNSYTGQTSSNGFGYCVECTFDGGGCASSNEVCQPISCLTGFANGVAGTCANCFLQGAGACGTGGYCADGGLIASTGGPDGGALLAGYCAVGCRTDADCGLTQPFCLDGGCVQCDTNSIGACPNWAPGCSGSHRCNSCEPNVVGSCPSSIKCDKSQCGNNKCVCFSDTDCPLDVPTCPGADKDAGVGGNCACTDSSQCPGGYVCETRAPYAVTSGCGQTVGGACIPACATSSDCSGFALAQGYSNPLTANLACDTTTGYCVPCAADQDCVAGADPTKPNPTPVCLLFPDGGNPNSTPTIFTGGGICGCTDTSQCNGGYTCESGSCVAPCTRVNGYDSCKPSYCNTYTGQCQQCLDDYDCIGNYTGGFCIGGACEGCRTAADCSRFGYGTPCVNNDCGSGPCTDDSQCPGDAGFTCFGLYTAGSQQGGGSSCNILCLVGDDAGLGTVADGGQPCPVEAPFCLDGTGAGTPLALDAGMGICSQCFGQPGVIPQDNIACDAGYEPGHTSYVYCYFPRCGWFCGCSCGC